MIRHHAAKDCARRLLRDVLEDQPVSELLVSLVATIIYNDVRKDEEAQRREALSRSEIRILHAANHE